MIRWIILTWVMLPISTLLAQSETNRFSRAHDAYEAGNIHQAIALYEDILADSMYSAELYYNLGTAYLALDSIASAVLNLERAMRMRPSDARVIENLELARGKVASDIYQVPDFILFRYWKSMVTALKPVQWVFLTAVGAMLTLASFYFWQFGPSGTTRYKAFIYFIILILCTVFIGIAAFESQKALSLKNEVIVMQNTVLRTGPDHRSGDKGRLSPGVKVTVMDSIDGWYKVELMNKDSGWLPGDIFKVI